jgi:uncharacterized membrane protein YgdD (TMEM256/DUF423 family)
MIARKLIIFGLLFVLLSIILGALGAHYIEKIGVDSDGLDTFDTGVRYMFYNGIGMLVIAALSDRFDFDLKSHYRAILWGTVLFSFSIFFLVLLPAIGIELNKFIGPITPIGGLIMIFGWFTLLIKYIRAADDS